MAVLTRFFDLVFCLDDLQMEIYPVAADLREAELSALELSLIVRLGDADLRG